ncbi:TPA: DUF2971 domain-containing protein [Stenotrophomonas maltophilia]
MEEASIQHGITVPPLYKFVGAERLVSILKNPSLRFTQPPLLNDPYECHLTLDRKEVMRDFRAYWRERNPAMEDAELDVRIQAMEAERLSDELLRYRDFRNNLGVVSLSEDPLNLLMWSHYGDEHRGAAIELDWTHTDLRPGSTGGSTYSDLVKVDYREDKVCGRPDPDTIIKVLSTKSPHWSYEREWRLIRTLNLTRKVQGDVHVVDFDLSAIKSIHLGANFKAHLLPEIRRLCDEQDGGHIQFLKVAVSPHRFQLRASTLEAHGWALLHREHHFGDAAPEALACLPMEGDI